MRALCRDDQHPQGSGSNRRSSTPGANGNATPHGSSETDRARFARAALEKTSAGAEQALAEYLADKHGKPSRQRGRAPDQILVLDVLNIYLADKAPGHMRPDKTKQRVMTLSDFWQPYTLADINGQRCRDYVKWRTSQQRRSSKPEVTGRPARPITESMARRELEDLRSAINHHRQEGLCSEIVSVRLIWAAWRVRQVMQDKVTMRPTGRHIARFILIGLYTGTRSENRAGGRLALARPRFVTCLNTRRT